MACGTPVTASCSGGLPEVIESGESGLLCPVGDTDYAIRAITALLRDRDQWEAMSRRAAAVVRERFALEKIVPHYEALYARLLRGDRT